MHPFTHLPHGHRPGLPTAKVAVALALLSLLMMAAVLEGVPGHAWLRKSHKSPAPKRAALPYPAVMNPNNVGDTSISRVAIVTGGAGKVGAVITRWLHRAGHAVAVHYTAGADRAAALAEELNAIRPNSAIVCGADFEQPDTAAQAVVSATIGAWGRVDVIVNNAGVFEPTSVATATMSDWTRHLNVNTAAAFFLAQQALPFLEPAAGVIINICDIHGERPLAGHSIYSVSKAALIALTKALAKDLGPHRIRVNGVSPGAISWIEGKHTEALKKSIVASTALGTTGSPEAIADAVLFLVRNDYVTGQIVSVDGGRTLNQ
eukprot:EG_transcript_5633